MSVPAEPAPRNDTGAGNLPANRELRAALGRYATGVAVVTVMDKGQAKGLVVNSFTSVSLDPPLVSWCIQRNSARLLPFLEEERHTISILSRQHESFCRQVAGRGGHSLTDAALQETEIGTPVVTGALAIFECRKAAAHDAGDHILMLSSVQRWSFAAHGDPLIFFMGRFAEIADTRSG